MKKRSIYSIIGTLSSILLLILAVRNVNYYEIKKAILQTNYLWLITGAIIFIGSMILTAARWQWILNRNHNIHLLETFSFICIGYFANSVLPMRIGDIARAFYFGRRKGISVEKALVSLVIEKVMDVLVLISILPLFALIINIPSLLGTAIYAIMIMTIILFITLLFLANHYNIFENWIRSAMRYLTIKQYPFIERIRENIYEALMPFRSPWVFMRIIFYSYAAWLAAGASMTIWLYACDLRIPWYAGFLILIAVNLASSLPSAPGYIGVYHYACVMTLSIWMDDKSRMFAYAVITHGINMLINMVLGTVFMLKEGITTTRIIQSRAQFQ